MVDERCPQVKERLAASLRPWTGMRARMVVLDAGDVWVLVQETDEVGVQRIAQYGLVVSS